MTIASADCIPTRCCIAPETPSPRYSAGLTTLPVWPIWRAYGIQPASTDARVAPTTPPSALGQLLTTREALRAADATPADDDDPRLLERRLRAGLGDPLEHLDRGGRAALGRASRRSTAPGGSPPAAAVVGVRADGDDPRSAGERAAA